LSFPAFFGWFGTASTSNSIFLATFESPVDHQFRDTVILIFTTNLKMIDRGCSEAVLVADSKSIVLRIESDVTSETRKPFLGRLRIAEVTVASGFASITDLAVVGLHLAAVLFSFFQFERRATCIIVENINSV